uniref:Uncharacterized protein n=1 Tax=Leersia perrieri TaxID=77586 RepID=A0A0D9UVU4_9ORYZ
MRAITGAVVSSKRCTLAKAANILTQFVENSASILPSSDAATYLRTAADATHHHRLFRLDLRRRYTHGDLPPPASPSASREKMIKHSKEAAATHVKHEVEDIMACADLVAQEDTDKDRRRRRMKLQGIVEQGIASPEKKRNNRKKHPEEVEIHASADLGSEKKRKKKRERGDDNENEQAEHTRKKPRN